MAKNLFVAGLAYEVSDDQLFNLFSQYGEVKSAKVIIDRDTGRSKGFGFVEMASEKDGSNAISTLNDTQFEGRSLMVKEARPKGDSNNYPRNNSYGNKNNRNGYDRRR